MRQDGEPSVEDILRSIKQVIARDDSDMRETVRKSAFRSSAPVPSSSDEDDEPVAMPAVARDEPFPPAEDDRNAEPDAVDDDEEDVLHLSQDDHAPDAETVGPINIECETENFEVQQGYDAADDRARSTDDEATDDRNAHGEDADDASADALIGGAAAEAMRSSLSALREKREEPPRPAPSSSDNALEEMVRSMLRPMLRDWLDANLPDIIERMVAREISRITGSR